MAKNNHQYPAPEHLFTFTGVGLGENLRETFRKIAASRANLLGYLRAVQIVVTGAVIQSAATAALAKEVIWNLLNISLRGNMHDWLKNVPSGCIFIQNVKDGSVKSTNVDTFVSADFVNNTDSQSFEQHFLIPMSPKAYVPAISQRSPRDGIFLLAGMRDWGEIEMNTRAALGGDWALDGDLTVKVLLHTYYSPRAIFPAPWVMDQQVSADNEIQFPARPRAKIDSVWCTDEDFDAWVIPAGNVRMELDGLDLVKNVTGAMLEDYQNCFSEDGQNDIVDNNFTNFLDINNSGSLADMPDGGVLKVVDANQSQGDSIARYVTRRYIPLNPEQTATYAALMGVDFDPTTEQGRIKAGSRTPDQLGLTTEQMAGFNFQVPI
jgi:hypothetical protein